MSGYTMTGKTTTKKTSGTTTKKTSTTKSKASKSSDAPTKIGGLTVGGGGTTTGKNARQQKEAKAAEGSKSTAQKQAKAAGRSDGWDGATELNPAWQGSATTFGDSAVGTVDTLSGEARQLGTADGLDTYLGDRSGHSPDPLWSTPGGDEEDLYEEGAWEAYDEAYEIYLEEANAYADAMADWVDWAPRASEDDRTMNSALSTDQDRLYIKFSSNAFDDNGYIYDPKFTYSASPGAIAERLAGMNDGQVAICEQVFTGDEYTFNIHGSVTTFFSVSNYGPPTVFLHEQDDESSPIATMFPDLYSQIVSDNNNFSTLNYTVEEANGIRDQFGFSWTNVETDTKIAETLRNFMSAKAADISSTSIRAQFVNKSVTPASRLDFDSISVFGDTDPVMTGAEMPTTPSMSSTSTSDY